MIVVNSLSALVAGNLLHSLLGSHRTTGSPLTAEARARGHRGRKFLDRGPWLPGSCCYWHWQERLIALARPVGCSRHPRRQCRDCTYFTVLWVICLIFRIKQVHVEVMTFRNFFLFHLSPGSISGFELIQRQVGWAMLYSGNTPKASSTRGSEGTKKMVADSTDSGSHWFCRYVLEILPWSTFRCD